MEGPRMAGSFGGSDYEISVYRPRTAEGGGDVPVSVSARIADRGGMLFLLRNCSSVNGPGGGTRFEVDAECDYLSARLVDGELRIRSDHRPNALRIPHEVGRVRVNDSPAAFTLSGGWLRLGKAISDGS